MTSLSLDPIVAPLRVDDHGAIRVGNTRVLLDLVIHEFQNGATPEGIVESYDVLSLSDVYAVLTHYLQNPGPIDDYMHRREDEAQVLRREIEAAQPPRPNLRETLLARLKAKGIGDASVDHRP